MPSPPVGTVRAAAVKSLIRLSPAVGSHRVHGRRENTSPPTVGAPTLWALEQRRMTAAGLRQRAECGFLDPVG